MDIFKIIGIGFLTAVGSILLRTTKPEISFAITVTGVIIILAFILDALNQTVTVFQNLTSIVELDTGILKILLKVVGIGYVTEFASSTLEDFGNSSIANKITLAGKVAVIVCALPIFESILNLVKEFLKLL